MLVKRLWENSGALKGSACFHFSPPFFNIMVSGFVIEDGRCALCCDCFSNVHYLLYILLGECVREEL